MQNVLKIMRGQWKILRTSWSICFIIYGQRCIIFSNFLDFLNLLIYVLLLIPNDE